VAAAPKVAHLTTTDVSLWYLLLPQLRALRDGGAEVLGISAPGPWVEALEAEGIRHVPLRSSTRAMDVRADVAAAWELRQILRRERPTVLHTHNPKPGIYGRIVGRLTRVPIVVNTVHGLYATEDDPWSRRAVVYALEAIASRFSDVELVQNPEDVEMLRRLAISPKARLLGNGVDLARFRPAEPHERRAARSMLDIGDDCIVVGSVGRLVAEKGFPELFEAMDQLDRRRYALVVVGGDDPSKVDALPPETLERAAAAGVRVLGHRDDVEALYHAMDVFALASHREGFPRSAMEAAASGLPVVLTDIRGCRQIVDGGRNGVLVPVGSAEALAAGIVEVGDDPERRATMGAASRAVAEDRFDETAVVRRVLGAYLEAANHKRVVLSIRAQR
jgi:glycosyltransferase involved in cell wall biosynthesis